MPNGRTTLEALERLLRAAEVDWEAIEHPAVRTAAEAALARDLPLEIGAKSIVLKTDDTFRLFAFSAATALRSRLLRRHLGVRRTRFATPDELHELTGIVPGAVPPFGEPILSLSLHVDPRLLDRPRIAFTPGVPTITWLITTDDYRRVAQPDVFPFVA